MLQGQLPTKVHKAAIAIIPPLQLTTAIQHIRCVKDKSYVRWPPHINLLYPFLEDSGDAFATAAVRAAEAVAGIKPFKLSLSTPAYFNHGRSFTMWLKPDESTGLIAVQSALEAAFPDCCDLSCDPSRGITSFTPHLSLGQWHNKQQMTADMQAYKDEGISLEFDVQEVCLLSRQGFQDPFTVRYAIPLGTSTTPPSAAYPQPQLVDVPYIATTAANLQQLLPIQGPTDKARFGLGASPTGIWNFAYGANMNPRKLGGSRGLHPLESRPGVLREYSLKFNHRGGFGNLVKVGKNDVKNSLAAAAAAARPPATPAAAAAAAAGCEVHGVLHRLTAAELSMLMGMEHEYWPVEVAVEPYPQQHLQQPEQQQLLSQPPDPMQTAAAAEAGSSGTALVHSRQHQLQQQQPILAVAFMSPPERCIRDNLPPIRRYLDHLIEGAQYWKLADQYTAWLQNQPSIPPEQRGDEYYTSVMDGQSLKAWPKIRTCTGSSQQQQRGGYKGNKRSRRNAPNS